MEQILQQLEQIPQAVVENATEVEQILQPLEKVAPNFGAFAPLSGGEIEKMLQLLEQNAPFTGVITG